MAKDDFFVVVYRVLSYLYERMKAGEAVCADFMSPAALGINEAYYVDILREMSENGYVKGIDFPRAVGMKGVKLSDPKITMAGIEYLQENHMMKMAAKAHPAAAFVV